MLRAPRTHATSPPASILGTRAGHRRVPCRPSLLPSLSPYPRATGPVSPQTLAPSSLHCHRPSSLAAADLPPSVSRSSIPRGESFSSPSSSEFGPHPALSPFLQGRRRAPRSAAAPARRAARPPPFPAVKPTGEPRRHLRIAVRTSPALLQPRLAAPARAATAVAARVRAHAAPRPRRGRTPGRVKASGLALTRPGWGAFPWGPPVGLWLTGVAGSGCT